MLVKIKSHYNGYGITDTRLISLLFDVPKLEGDMWHYQVWIGGLRFAVINVDQWKKLLELMLYGEEMKEI